MLIKFKAYVAVSGKVREINIQSSDWWTKYVKWAYALAVCGARL